MKAAVLRETFPGEKRVALVAGNLAQLQKAGIDVIVESGAGESAGITDADYEAKGATIATDRQAAFDADLVLQVRSLGANPDNGASDLSLMKAGQLIVGTCDPLGSAEAAAKLATTGVTAFSLELIPRITRAQSMDVLSSQATIAGYRAVLLAANELPKIFPLLMTAAGTLTAARVFVIGAGVAGLQAIATARRLGGIVQAYDVRPACREQVESLGAKFVELQLEAAESEDQGGYAKALGEDFYQKQRELMAAVVSESDVVITTAAIPGQTSPLLITTEAVEGMASGGVIVDLAAERGGNCELSVADQRIVKNGVVILGPTNLPAEIPNHASQMFSNNVTNFLLNLVKDGEINLDLDDEIIAGTIVTHKGQVSNSRIRELLGLEALNETPEQRPEPTSQTFNTTQDQNMEPTSNEVADSINDEEPAA